MLCKTLLFHNRDKFSQSDKSNSFLLAETQSWKLPNTPHSTSPASEASIITQCIPALSSSLAGQLERHQSCCHPGSLPGDRDSHSALWRTCPDWWLGLPLFPKPEFQLPARLTKSTHIEHAPHASPRSAARGKRRIKTRVGRRSHGDCHAPSSRIGRLRLHGNGRLQAPPTAAPHAVALQRKVACRELRAGPCGRCGVRRGAPGTSGRRKTALGTTASGAKLGEEPNTRSLHSCHKPLGAETLCSKCPPRAASQNRTALLQS